MKKTLTILVLAISAATANAQYYYQDAKNPDMLRHAERHEPCRKEIVLPQVNGYTVYKADLHTHTVFSDGTVLPKFRVQEAWQDGLDIMAVTEHIEHRPSEATFYEYLKGYAGKEYIPKAEGAEQDKRVVDLNFAIGEAQKEAVKYGLTIIPGTEITRNGTSVGHFNALFTTDNNIIYDADPVQAVRNAKAQGALVMHNHPGWSRTSITMTETEVAVYGEGLVDGVEVINGKEFYPGIIDRVHERGLFISANTDVHFSTANDYRLTGHHRPMTLVLAKDKSLASVREALEARRTIAYGFHTLCGEEQLLKDFVAASVKVTPINEKTVMLTNTTSVPYVFKRGNGNQFRLDPFSSVTMGVSQDTETVKLTVLNAWTGADARLVAEIKVK